MISLITPAASPIRPIVDGDINAFFSDAVATIKQHGPRYWCALVYGTVFHYEQSLPEDEFDELMNRTNKYVDAILEELKMPSFE